MANRQAETYHQAKERLNAALQAYGLRVDCMMPWHHQAWNLYRKEGNAYVLVMEEDEGEGPGWLRRLMPKPAPRKVSFNWDVSPEEILLWARARRVIDASMRDENR